MPIGSMYFDPTIILMIPAILLTAYAQCKVSNTFNKYNRVRAASNMTGAQIARFMLDMNGLQQVAIQPVAGNLTDHYDPRDKVLRLSQSTYNSCSVAALGVAAHECGHAVQDAEGYIPLRFRNTLVPVANLGSRFSWLLIIVGLLFSLLSLMRLGIFAFCAVVLFQLITLPVEFNASNRAMAALEGGGFMDQEELHQTGKVLKAAALTYVAAALTSILQLARLLLIFNRGNRR